MAEAAEPSTSVLELQMEAPVQDLRVRALRFAFHLFRVCAFWLQGLFQPSYQLPRSDSQFPSRSPSWKL